MILEQRVWNCFLMGQRSSLEWTSSGPLWPTKASQLFLYGRKFTLVTDHQPLTRIFGPKSSVPPLAGARLQRWAVLLSGYNFDIFWHITHLWQFLCYCSLGQLNLGREFILIMLRWKVNNFSLWLIAILNGWKSFRWGAPLQRLPYRFWELCFLDMGCLPLELVSDNGPQFVAREFQKFLKMNYIKNTLCPPYHPFTKLMVWQRDMYKLSSGCTGLVLTRSHFSTRWLMSYSATETHHVLLLTKPLLSCF